MCVCVCVCVYVCVCNRVYCIHVSGHDPLIFSFRSFSFLIGWEFYGPNYLYNSIRNKTINKLDENERNINTLLFGNDQLHLETNKKIFAIVHDFLRQTDRL